MSEQRAVPEIPEDLRQDYALTVESLPTADDNSRRVLGQIKYYIERIATLTSERDALAATLRQGAESDTDLRKRYEAMERENGALKADLESVKHGNGWWEVTPAGQKKRCSVNEEEELRIACDEATALKEQVARLSAPVSDAEQEDICKLLGRAETNGDSLMLTAIRIINFFASRTAPAKP